ncbi:6 kDa early secretory antigenic target [Corynebacterium capitovis DSM 44611]|uniref:WXG100 family type VII secretion target n=1 Tax=Corynebacterium capitovis TaxID=131081 RepID=UPI00037B2F16|nr:WXG100 family type VII secretion target [Corynebacterium capitovis]WKD56905.1 6 kDa early secretory antigenic target [Corynebacterium capitovis DSM 44611]
MEIKYGFGQLSGAAQDMDASAARIAHQLEELKSLLQPMVATWEGDAAEAYYAHQQKWDQAAEELNTILTTIATTVEEGNNRMQAVNAAAAASWG